MIYVEKNNYRIAFIFSITSGDRPVKYGLALEKKYIDDKERWCAICLIKYDKKEQRTKLESVGVRLLDIEPSEWKVAKELLDTASKLVASANLLI